MTPKPIVDSSFICEIRVTPPESANPNCAQGPSKVPFPSCVRLSIFKLSLWRATRFPSPNLPASPVKCGAQYVDTRLIDQTAERRRGIVRGDGQCHHHRMRF